MKEKRKTSTFYLSEDSKALLPKLAKLQDRSMAGVLNYLIKKESKEYGLIEARD
jgi:hypothetical protein